MGLREEGGLKRCKKLSFEATDTIIATRRVI